MKHLVEEIKGYHSMLELASPYTFFKMMTPNALMKWKVQLVNMYGTGEFVREAQKLVRLLERKKTVLNIIRTQEPRNYKRFVVEDLREILSKANHLAIIQQSKDI